MFAISYKAQACSHRSMRFSYHLALLCPRWANCNSMTRSWFTRIRASTIMWPWEMSWLTIWTAAAELSCARLHFGTQRVFPFRDVLRLEATYHLRQGLRTHQVA